MGPFSAFRSMLELEVLCWKCFQLQQQQWLQFSVSFSCDKWNRCRKWPIFIPFFFLPLVASTSGRRGSSAWQLPVGSIDQALSRGRGDRREGNLVLSRSFLVFGYTLILRTLEEFGAPLLLFQIWLNFDLTLYFIQFCWLKNCWTCGRLDLEQFTYISIRIWTDHTMISSPK